MQVFFAQATLFSPTSLGLSWGLPKIQEEHFRGPHKRDCSILGYIFGVPLFWEITICVSSKLRPGWRHRPNPQTKMGLGFWI